MEIPIYHTFNEFEENYILDFAESNPQQSFLRYLTVLKIKYSEKSEECEYYIDNYENNVEKEIIAKTSVYEFLTNEGEQFEFINRLTIDDEENLPIYPLNAKERLLHEIQNAILIRDQVRAIMLQKRLEFSNIKQILDFIDEKITNEKFNLIRFQNTPPPLETVEVPELDFSDNSDKVKLIMLEKLGIIEYIKTIQTKPNTISHTSEILSAITGIETKTLNTYLYPMLRPYRDDEDKNSPYKNPENLEKAERELIKLKIKNIDANR